MITRSTTPTPFGLKTVYAVNGECLWSEYVAAPSPAPRNVSRFRAWFRRVSGRLLARDIRPAKLAAR